MPWCHRCRLEYLDGTPSCLECSGVLIEAPAPERREPIRSKPRADERRDDAHVGVLFVTLVIVGIALALSAFMFAARWFLRGNPL